MGLYGYLQFDLARETSPGDRDPPRIVGGLTGNLHGPIGPDDAQPSTGDDS